MTRKFDAISLLMIIIGIGLIVYPEPATTATGLLLVAGAFALEAG